MEKTMQDLLVTIAIPTYNQSKTLEATLQSALAQTYKNKEILVSDDDSKDNTVALAKSFKGVRVICQPENIGIGSNLVALMNAAKGEIVVYLCGDDLFADTHVVEDLVAAFKADPDLGVVTRSYYEFLDGTDIIVGTFRKRDLLLSSCNPSGMAFWKDFRPTPCNKTFIEMPSIVAQYLRRGFSWTMLEYDTVAVRIHPGGNTATKEEYYVDSPTENWFKLCGKDIGFYAGFIQYKNRCPKILWREICKTVSLNRWSLLRPSFWFYSLTALIVPTPILREASSLHRKVFGKMFARKVVRNR